MGTLLLSICPRGVFKIELTCSSYAKLFICLTRLIIAIRSHLLGNGQDMKFVSEIEVTKTCCTRKRRHDCNNHKAAHIHNSSSFNVHIAKLAHIIFWLLVITAHFNLFLIFPTTPDITRPTYWRWTPYSRPHTKVTCIQMTWMIAANTHVYPSIK